MPGQADPHSITLQERSQYRGAADALRDVSDRLVKEAGIYFVSHHDDKANIYREIADQLREESTQYSVWANQSVRVVAE